ncbi:collagen-like triple helix repeat-containing protein [Pseudomonas putida]|uniref:collagen-like triple helix repeat-containing protein n=1 Tax=Pseudomonas putida TaxID=303 RepID=UPI001120B23C|nr:collagen-like protein [Pseudomonas putida]
MIASVNIKTDVAGGNPGLGGEGGWKGAPGGSKWETLMPSGQPGDKGDRGYPGSPGKDARTDPGASWVDIDVMDFETYKALLAQQTFRLVEPYKELLGNEALPMQTFEIASFTREQVLWSQCENIDVLGASKKICAYLIRHNLSLLVRIDVDGNTYDITVANLKMKIYELPGGFYVQLGIDRIALDSENKPNQICMALEVCSDLNCMKVMDECINF